ncbi:substrate-binding domain-containing protein [Ideonella livida]|nr:substrate-binding domain-containing protein [Ideonella livida]
MTLSGISSMATRLLLAELTPLCLAQGGPAAHIESVGGVDAAKRVMAGEAFDVVILASDAIAKLAAAGRVLQDSVTDLVHSGVAVAVPAGAARPDLGSEAAVRAAVLAAPTLGYSTGPSGVALAKLFERWGIAQDVAARLVTPPPGVPVGSLVASGQIALGFQQLSELLHVPGIDLLGPLPAEIQITTTFTGAVVAGSPREAQARALLAFLASPAAADAKRRQGMDPA